MPHRGVSLVWFSQKKICRVCTPFQDALAAKIALDLLKGLWSYWGFKVRGSGSPKFSAPPSGKTMRQTPKSIQRCKNVLEVLYHHAKFGGARISPAAGVAKNVEFFRLFVCLSVTLLNVRDCAPDFAMKALEYRNDFDTIG